MMNLRSGGLLKLVAILALISMLSHAQDCVAIGTTCRKNGDACCASTNVEVTSTACVGNSDFIVLRQYTCQECTAANNYCFDSVPIGESTVFLIATALVLMMIFYAVVVFAVEVLKANGTLPEPPNDNVRRDDFLTSEEILAAKEEAEKKAQQEAIEK